MQMIKTSNLWYWSKPLKHLHEAQRLCKWWKYQTFDIETNLWSIYIKIVYKQTDKSVWLNVRVLYTKVTNNFAMIYE